MSTWTCGLACLLLGAIGCSDSTEPGPSGAGGGGASGDAGGDASAGAETETAGEGGASGEGGADATGALDAPDEEAALLAFLDSKSYAGWAKEAEPHASAGPHRGTVRVHYSPKAALARSSDAQTFPAGAASVKELMRDGSLYGYAVWVKVQDATDEGNGFFWYEIIEDENGEKSVYGNSLGSGVCVSCHSAGRDYDLSTLPIE